MTISALALPVCAQDSTGRTDTPPRDTMTPATQPAMTGDRAQAPEAKHICGTLKNATEAAIKTDGYDNLVKRFVDADRDRIKKFDLSKDDKTRLNDRVVAIQRAWKAKYNQDFDIDNPMLVFDDRVRIVQGVIGEAQPAAGHMAGDQTDASKIDPSLPDTSPGPQADKVAGGDVNREPGRKVAKVTFPTNHGMPALYIPLIREFPDSWKIDVPDQVDGQKLYSNLIDQLTMIDNMKDQWPSDVNDAYRAVSHHVLMAIMDQKPDMTHDKMGDKTGDMPPTDNSGSR